MSEYKKSKNKVTICMGSQSDWPTLKISSNILNDFSVVHEVKIISAHRTPDRLSKFSSEAKSNGIEVIIAGAGGAAHLPGMLASYTNIPVLGVPILSKSLSGIDSLLSIVQMPGGVPVATFAIGDAGAKNAALFAIQILSLNDQILYDKLFSWKENQTNSVPLGPLNQ